MPAERIHGRTSRETRSKGGTGRTSVVLDMTYLPLGNGARREPRGLKSRRWYWSPSASDEVGAATAGRGSYCGRWWTKNLLALGQGGDLRDVSGTHPSVGAGLIHRTHILQMLNGNASSAE